MNDSMKSLLKTGVSLISRADYGKNWLENIKDRNRDPR